MTTIPDVDQLTAASWMLFDDMEGAAEAASELSQALEEAMTLDTVEQAWAHIDPVRFKWAEHGALDSEPRRVVEAYFDVVFTAPSERCYEIGRDGYQVPFV